MFDNVGRSNDEEALTRTAVAFTSTLVMIGLVGLVVFVYTALRVTEELTGLDLIDEDMIELAFEDEPEAEAPPPPPPPPPPPAPSAPDDPEDDPEDDTTPTPDDMVEDVVDLKKIDEKQVTAKRPKGVVGGVEGGVEGGVVGGVQGGIVGGEIGGKLGGVRTFHHSEVKVKRRVQPRYPEAAKTLNMGDQSCRVNVFIDEAGKPYDLKYAACPKVFHDSIHQAIMAWRWYPARDEAHNKVRAKFMLNIKYKLK